MLDYEHKPRRWTLVQGEEGRARRRPFFWWDPSNDTNRDATAVAVLVARSGDRWVETLVHVAGYGKLHKRRSWLDTSLMTIQSGAKSFRRRHGRRLGKPRE